jgi:glycosyltransferase involved in cell wall biosynthesis
MKTIETHGGGMKADLHVHSKYSDRPTEWFLRRIGAPECFTEPDALYRTCREKGMDVVTITDHNSIRGALEIAHLPNTFISSELTTYFPEDDCKIHCLVYDITEVQFNELQEARKNIYELRRYLADNHILHSVAHPLFRVNDQLEVAHVEKLLVLFDRFEVLNGSRHPRAGDLTRLVFSTLTGELIGEMAERHGLTPYGETPWVKRFTGGSDDHSGVHVAGAFTLTPQGRSVADYLEHVRAGRHEAGGVHGSSVKLAHSLYHIAYSYYRSRMLKQGGGFSVLGEVVKRFLDGYEVAGSKGGPIRTWVGRVARRRKLRRLSPTERMIVDAFCEMRQERDPEDGMRADGASREARCFQTAAKVSHELSRQFLDKFLHQLGEGRLVDGLQTAAAMGSVMLGVAPYLTSFGVQHKDEAFLQAVAGRFPAAEGLQRCGAGRVWITDTFEDVNGAAHTIRAFAEKARARSIPLTVMTCLETPPTINADVMNFKPLGTFSLPEYETQKLAFPPFLNVIEAIERGNFREVIISTPGPMGLCGLAAAKLLGLSAVGVYHTDFPQYIRDLTQDEVMEQMTWKYMLWFYGQMGTVYVPSDYYAKQLTEKGIAASVIRVLPRGVDRERFSPRKRSKDFWVQHGMNGNFKLLYVGRVSKEKNLGVLMEAFWFVRSTTPNVDLVIVGDGPELQALKAATVDPNVKFLGALRGEALSHAYASSDLFVFPSVSDTFGNVVLEAHASGLPAIVSNRGGPAELVRRYGSGVAVDVRTPAPFCSAIRELIWDKERRQALSQCALAAAEAHDWDQIIEEL